ncbi:MAG: FecR domain-containing protein, partial [Myxococcota bacterium]
MSDARERARIAELGTSIATLQDAELAERADLRDVRSRLLRPRRRDGRGRWAAAATLALGALTAVLLATAPRATLRVNGRRGPLAESSWVAAERTPQTLRVSDGSELVVGPQTTLRVAELGRRHLRLDVQTGDLSLDASRGAARIELTAGPFRVAAAGTRSALTWAPEEGRFTLSVQEGEAQLEGPTVAVRTVRAGEHVRVELHEQRLTVAPSPPVAAPEPAAEPE